MWFVVVCLIILLILVILQNIKIKKIINHLETKGNGGNREKLEDVIRKVMEENQKHIIQNQYDLIEKNNDNTKKYFGELINNINTNQKSLNDYHIKLLKTIEEGLKKDITNFSELQGKQFENFEGNVKNTYSNIDKILESNQSTLYKNLDSLFNNVETRLSSFETGQEQRNETIRNTLSESLKDIREDNNARLESMQKTVDDKLHHALETKLTETFKVVNDRLEQVYKGLGEMKTLAEGVGDLKKVLSNVKTRGVLGEIQLAAILEEILTKEQYEVNVATRRGSTNVVEFAVKLPGQGDKPIYLPIDSKFPADAYMQVLEAYDKGNKEEIQKSIKDLMTRVKTFAKDISSKYIDVPNTTDFAIMFIPFEGLYAEIVKSNIVEELQRDYRIIISGPTTMAALLNSLQMGFRTLEIQKRSSEVWSVLESVKTEFEKFEDALSKTQQKLTQANTELEKLVGVRTRTILKSLQKIDSIEMLEK